MLEDILQKDRIDGLDLIDRLKFRRASTNTEMITSTIFLKMSEAKGVT